MSEEKKLLARVHAAGRGIRHAAPPGARCCAASAAGWTPWCLLHFLAQPVRDGMGRSSPCTPATLTTASAPRVRMRTRAFVRAAVRGAGTSPSMRSGRTCPITQRSTVWGWRRRGRKLRYDYFNKMCRPSWAARSSPPPTTPTTTPRPLLLHLVRGSGLTRSGRHPAPPGRSGAPAAERCPRALIEAYAAEQGIPFVEDASNADPAYTPRIFCAHQGHAAAANS